MGDDRNSFARYVERYEAGLDDEGRARFEALREHYREEAERLHRKLDGDDPEESVGV